MRFQQLCKAVCVATYGAAEIFAMTHGEFGEFNGLVIRYHQLADGVYTGVPAEEWDDEIHKRGDEVWDLDKLSMRGLEDDDDETVVGLETRDIEEIREKCHEVVNCAASRGKATISSAYNAWIAAVAKAKPACKNFFEFLDRPFWATWVGVAIGGVISAHINSYSMGSCNPANRGPLGTDAEVVRNVVAHAVAAHVDATDMSITVNGPSGEWTVSISSTNAKDVTNSQNQPYPACRR